MRLTLQEARNQLYRAGTLDVDSQENIEIFNQRLNLVQERFINEGKWVGTMQPVRFNVPSTNILTLPRQFASALAVKYVKGNCHQAVTIQNQWYSYQAHTNWLWNFNLWGDYGFNREINDIGDGYVTYIKPPYTSFYIRFTCASSLDYDKEVLVKGNDADGNSVFSQEDNRAYEGEKLTLGAPFVQTTSAFTTFDFAQKPITSDWLYVDVVDVATGGINRVAAYEPSETTISWRRYRLDCPTQIDYIEAICKRRFVPCLIDTDEVYPANFGALQNGLMALVYMESGDPQRYETHMQIAYDLLNGEMKEERGGAKFTLKIDPACFQMGKLWQGR